jgi:hypothetical protein
MAKSRFFAIRHSLLAIPAYFGTRPIR